jgi:hypothetical protein
MPERCDGSWRPFSPFGRVHLTLFGARALFTGLPLRFVSDTSTAEATKRQHRALQHARDLLMRPFFKNAQYEVIAVREP